MTDHVHAWSTPDAAGVRVCLDDTCGERQRARRFCDWCLVEPIPPGSRSDRLTCSMACHVGRARARAVGFLGGRAAWRRYKAGQLAWIPPVTPTTADAEGSTP